MSDVLVFIGFIGFIGLIVLACWFMLFLYWLGHTPKPKPDLFIVFGGSLYYPGGGVADYLGQDATLEAAMKRGGAFLKVQRYSNDSPQDKWFNILAVLGTGEIKTYVMLDFAERLEDITWKVDGYNTFGWEH